jgi:hypothetical protein
VGPALIKPLRARCFPRVTRFDRDRMLRPQLTPPKASSTPSIYWSSDFLLFVAWSAMNRSG